MKLTTAPRAAIVATALALSGCVSPPMGPTVPVMPGQGKSPQAFAGDQAVCTQYARSVTGPQAAAANNRTVGSALIGTALGAGLGAAIGGGRGAAIGAASGAVAGTAYGAAGANYQQMSLQQQFDALYAQCMDERGNEVPGFRPPPGMPPYGPPPPPRRY